MKDLFNMFDTSEAKYTNKKILRTKVIRTSNNTKKIKTHSINKDILPSLFYNTFLPLI